MEFLLYAGSLILIFYFYKLDSQYLNISKIVFFGLASSKALPSFNQVFTSIVNIKSSFSYIVVFSEEINLILNQKEKYLTIDNHNDLILDKIKLNNVSFSFTENKNFNIEELNIEINKNSFVAICGKSGSGKTTIVDLLSGVYQPNKGFLSLGNLKINNSNINNYRKIISYVPQEFYMADGTIREAITFGEKKYFDDTTQMNFALKFSGALEFVNNLPNKIDTEISDRGMNLSIGQKQRISIARALYKKPKILILDESTNSLDLITEKNILNNLKSLCNFMTIVLISHKVLSLEICDYLFLIKDGKIFDKGTYDDLHSSSEYFKELTNN